MVRKKDRQEDRWLKERGKKIEFMSQFQTDRLVLQKRQLNIRYELVDIWLDRESYRQIIILLEFMFVRIRHINLDWVKDRKIDGQKVKNIDR